MLTQYTPSLVHCSHTTPHEPLRMATQSPAPGYHTVMGWTATLRPPAPSATHRPRYAQYPPTLYAVGESGLCAVRRVCEESGGSERLKCRTCIPRPRATIPPPADPQRPTPPTMMDGTVYCKQQTPYHSVETCKRRPIVPSVRRVVTPPVVKQRGGGRGP